MLTRERLDFLICACASAAVALAIYAVAHGLLASGGAR